MLKLHIANGADVDEMPDFGKTPLHFAERMGHKEMAELLRRHGAQE